MSDPRFVDVAEQLLGKPVLGIAPEGNFFIGDTRWHPDAGSFDYTGVKFCIYPDRLNASNGALRVIPGSHHEPLYRSTAKWPERVHKVARQAEHLQMRRSQRSASVRLRCPRLQTFGGGCIIANI